MFIRAILPNEKPKQPEVIAKQAERHYPPLALSVEQMAEELSISDKTAYWLVHQPDFPSLKVKGRFIVNYKRLQDWLDTHCLEAYPE